MSNEVAVSSQYSRANVPVMLEQINEKIAALKGTGKKEKNTAGIIVPGFSKTLDNIDGLDTLIKIDSMIQAKAKAYKASAKAIVPKGAKVPEFTVENISPAKWREDIKARYSEVSYKDQLAKLEAAKELLEQNLDKDAKFENDMAKIMTSFAE